jgi:hypothetical protein
MLGLGGDTLVGWLTAMLETWHVHTERSIMQYAAKVELQCNRPGGASLI